MNRKKRKMIKLQRKGTYQAYSRKRKLIIKEAWFKVGQEVWDVLPSGIVVKCKITEREEWARRQVVIGSNNNKVSIKINTTGTLFYKIDELIGHSRPSNEISTTFEEALNLFKEIYQDPDDLELHKTDCMLDDKFCNFTLQDTRIRLAKSILSTHSQDNYGKWEFITIEAAQKLIDQYCGKNKIHKVDWFNYNDLKQIGVL
jgi:hypothetical protein